jgi:hypothetical protein
MIKLYFAIILVALLLLGVEGCPQGSVTGGGAAEGLDFYPVSGVGYISAGKEVSLGESLFAKLHFENYDKQGHQGQICVRDDIADAYGGIPRDECKSFSIKNAEIIGTAGQLQSAKTDVIFPESGEYAYHDIPISQAAKLFVDLKYAQSSKVTGILNSPSPETEKLNLQQDDAILKADIEKTVRRRAEGYQIDLSITIQKMNNDAKIYSPDFSKQYLLLGFGGALDFKCTPDIQNGIEFESTKFIKCSALTTEETQTAYPLIINMDYGVALTKTYNFNIKEEK